MEPANQPQIESPKPVRHVPAEESCRTDYASAIRQYHLYGRGRTMRAFCEEEGYSYTKFCYYARHGQSGQTVVKEKEQGTGGFIELKVEQEPEQNRETQLSLSSIVIEFTNGMVLSQRGGELDALMDVVRKMLS